MKDERGEEMEQQGVLKKGVSVSDGYIFSGRPA